MNLGVISDTHGNLGLMYKAVDLLKSRFLVKRIIHLGDDYADKVLLEQEGRAVSGVPGLWCQEYQDATIPNTLVEEFEGLRIACAHSADDLPPLTSDIGLVLTGHTHRCGITLRGGIPAMNPGHLKSEVDRMRPPTVGVVQIMNATIRLSIHKLDGSTVQREEYPFTPCNEDCNCP